MLYTSSSIRVRPIIETLKKAKLIAGNLGITRVCDITYLDYIGIPVFASIRPTSQSICVHAGKGVYKEEAEIGAYMEAIEYAYAEYNSRKLDVRKVKINTILDCNKRDDALFDFCPPIGTSVDRNREIYAIEATDVFTGKRYCIPAEIAIFPLPNEFKPYIFGSNTNGLASGNSILEASIHGLCEVIERDIQSFQRVQNTTKLVNSELLPIDIKQNVEKIKNAGLKIFLRYTENKYQLPYFYACIFDPTNLNPLHVNTGYGCHPNAVIAANRAICEAVQSRLSYIHGARDDLIHYINQFSTMNSTQVTHYLNNIIYTASSENKVIDFKDIQDYPSSFDSLEELWDDLINNMKICDFKYILRVTYTQPSDELHVVRIIVPQAENFTPSTMRIGKRLKKIIENSNN